MGDINHGDVVSLVELFEISNDLIAESDVEGGNGFVEEEETWRCGDASG